MKIEDFLNKVSARVNQGVLIKATIGCVLVFSVISLLCASVYVIRGYAAPALGYLVAGIAGGVVFAVWIGRSWMRTEAVAVFADRFFRLKDGIVSARFLSDSDSSEINKLQLSWIEDKLKSCDYKRIPLNFPKKLAILAGLLAIGAGCMSMIPTSERILAQVEDGEATFERSEEAVEKIKEIVKEMEKDLSAKEEEEIDTAEIRKMVDELEPNTQKDKVARQFAKLEQKTRDMSKSLKQKKEGEVLKQAIKELEQSNSKVAKELAQKLKLNEAKRAKELLEKLTPKKLNEKNLSKDQIAEMKKKLDEMRDVTKRLAAAANKANQQKGAMNDSGKAGEAGKPSDDLAAQMAQLDKNAQQLEKILKEMKLVEMRGGKVEAGKLNGEIDKFAEMAEMLGNKFMKMEAKKSAEMRLSGLSKMLSKSQNFVNGQGARQGLDLNMPGGLKPGSGVNDQRKVVAEELANKGTLEQLEGLKGDGPSLSKIEEADSGTGVSNSLATAKAQDFSRQMESFIQRDSVPEDLKIGVREYFKTVHEIEQE